jgi:hypothetical protein
MGKRLIPPLSVPSKARIRRRSWLMGRGLGPGGGQLLGTIPGKFEARKHGCSRLDVHGPGPGKAAGQLEGRVPHEALDDPGRDPGRVGERRRLAPQGMEIEE